MNIRFATLADIAVCVELGYRIHRSTRLSRFPYEREVVEKNLRSLIITGQQHRRSHCLLLAEDLDGVVVGALIGCIESHLFSSRPIANLLAYGVVPGHRMSGAAVRLLKSFVEWAKRRGVDEVNIGVNSGIAIDRTDRFMKKMGFAKTGGNYAMCLRQEKSACSDKCRGMTEGRKKCKR